MENPPISNTAGRRNSRIQQETQTDGSHRPPGALQFEARPSHANRNRYRTDRTGNPKFRHRNVSERFRESE